MKLKTSKWEHKGLGVIGMWAMPALFALMITLFNIHGFYVEDGWDWLLVVFYMGMATWHTASVAVEYFEKRS